jgi:hypothetical protein
MTRRWLDHPRGPPTATNQPRSPPSTSPADSSAVSAARQVGTLSTRCNRLAGVTRTFGSLTR